MFPMAHIQKKAESCFILGVLVCTRTDENADSYYIQQQTESLKHRSTMHFQNQPSPPIT